MGHCGEFKSPVLLIVSKKPIGVNGEISQGQSSLDVSIVQLPLSMAISHISPLLTLHLVTLANFLSQSVIPPLESMHHKWGFESFKTYGVTHVWAKILLRCLVFVHIFRNLLDIIQVRLVEMGPLSKIPKAEMCAVWLQWCLLQFQSFTPSTIAPRGFGFCALVSSPNRIYDL